MIINVETWIVSSGRKRTRVPSIKSRSQEAITEKSEPDPAISGPSPEQLTDGPHRVLLLQVVPHRLGTAAGRAASNLGLLLLTLFKPKAAPRRLGSRHGLAPLLLRGSAGSPGQDCYTTQTGVTILLGLCTKTITTRCARINI